MTADPQGLSPRPQQRAAHVTVHVLSICSENIHNQSYCECSQCKFSFLSYNKSILSHWKTTALESETPYLPCPRAVGAWVSPPLHLPQATMSTELARGLLNDEPPTQTMACWEHRAGLRHSHLCDVYFIIVCPRQKAEPGRQGSRTTPSPEEVLDKL